jgi:hypothetical protein
MGLALPATPGIQGYADSYPPQVTGQPLGTFEIDLAKLADRDVEGVLQQVLRALVVVDTAQEEESQAVAVTLDQPGLRVTVAITNAPHNRCRDLRLF